MIHPQNGHTTDCQSGAGEGQLAGRDQRSNCCATPPYVYAYTESRPEIRETAYT